LLLCKQNELPNREIARLVKYMVEIFGDGGTDLQILKPILPYNKIPKLGRLFALSAHLQIVFLPHLISKRSGGWPTLSALSSPTQPN
jgi:hypothetical protein